MDNVNLSLFCLKILVIGIDSVYNTPIKTRYPIQIERKIKMGWTCLNQRFKDKKHFAEFIVDEFKGYQAKSQKEGDEYWNILSTTLINNNLLIFAERTNSQGQTEKDIFVYLLGRTKNEYRYKNIDAFCGPYDEVPLAKKWYDWFMQDNALLIEDDRTSEWAIKWVNNCYQKMLKNRTKAQNKRQLLALLKKSQSVPVRLTYRDFSQVTLVGSGYQGKMAKILDTNGQYRFCKWKGLEPIS